MQKLIVFTCLLLAVLAKDLYQCPKDVHFGMQCTMEYEPVCGYSANGLRYFTYSNGCVACVSGAIEYTKGGCEDNQLMGKIPAVEKMMQKPLEKQDQQQQCISRGKMCTKEFKPVCGYFKESIQCFAPPCAQTYSNNCMACANEDVAYTKPGKCQDPKMINQKTLVKEPVLNEIPKPPQKSSASSGFNAPTKKSTISYCTGVRPEMCTMEYEPVCGYFGKCNSQNIEDCRRTFGNRCQACAGGADFSDLGACGEEDNTM